MSPTTNVLPVNVNAITIKNILSLIQMVLINSILYYTMVSIYRRLWVIYMLIAVSTIKRVCFPPAPAPPAIKKNGKLCAVCEASCKSKCQTCKKVYYCCREHQISDWKEHKKICHVIVIN
jgi:hypothetical protein